MQHLATMTNGVSTDQSVVDKGVEDHAVSLLTGNGCDSQIGKTC